METGRDKEGELGYLYLQEELTSVLSGYAREINGYCPALSFCSFFKPESSLNTLTRHGIEKRKADSAPAAKVKIRTMTIDAANDHLRKLTLTGCEFWSAKTAARAIRIIAIAIRNLIFQSFRWVIFTIASPVNSINTGACQGAHDRPLHIFFY